MKNVEKVILIGTALYAPLSANAGGWGTPTAPTGVATNLEGTTGVIIKATNWILGFVALIAVLMIIWGGVQYLTAAGDQDRTRSGKDTITHAVMGLVIAGLAYAIVNLIVTTIS